MGALVAAALAGVALAGVVAPDAAHARDRELDLGIGWRGARLETRLDQRFALHGPGVALSWFEGDAVGVWVAVEPWFPVRAADGRQASFRPRAHYDRALAFDASLLAAGRWRPGPGWTLTAGAGVHADGILLAGGGYEPFRSFTFGLGTAVAVRRRLGPGLHVGLTATGALDFIDLAHTGDGLAWGLVGGIAANVGWVIE